VAEVPMEATGSNFTTEAQNGVAITRHLGMFVSNQNAPSEATAVAGQRRPVLVVTLTVE
jgi:hypothetical protein